MRKLFTTILAVILTFSLVACNRGIKDDEIKIALAFSPMDGILDLIKDDLKKDGYNLSYEVFEQNYYTPNIELIAKNFDANMIQHAYFMEDFNSKNNADLVHSMNIYHAKFGIYTKTKELPVAGNTIAIPEDPTNLARALHLLKVAGLVNFNDDIIIPKVTDLDEHEFTFKELPLASIAKLYSDNKDIHAVVMYPTNATMLENNGADQLVYAEDPTQKILEKFGIALVVRQDNQDSPKIKALKNRLNSEKVRNYIIETYGWASIPSF